MIDPYNSVHTSEDAAGKTWRGERPIALMLFVATLLLHIAYVFRYPIDSDEPQHLHVVWGWAHGLLPRIVISSIITRPFSTCFVRRSSSLSVNSRNCCT